MDSSASTPSGAPPPPHSAIPDTSQRSDGSHPDRWSIMGTGGDINVVTSGMPPTSSTASVFASEQQQGGSITRFAAAAVPTGYVSPFAAPAPAPPQSYAARSQQAYSRSGGSGNAMYTPQGGGMTPSYAPPQQPQPPLHGSPQYQTTVGGASPQYQATVGASPQYATPQQYPTASQYPAPSPSFVARSAQYGPSTTTAPPTPTVSSTASVAAVPPTSNSGAAPNFRSSVATPLSTDNPQQRMLNDAIRSVQEHAYYMKLAMNQGNLAVVLDRAAQMVGVLGGPAHGTTTATTNTTQWTPKNYYELYMRALEDMPVLEDYLLQLTDTPMAAAPASAAFHTLPALYDAVQYCPRVVARLYLQIATGVAWLRRGAGVRVLRDLAAAVRCEQNPVRGLFVRYFLLTALREALPGGAVPRESAEADKEAEEEKQAADQDMEAESEPGTVKDSYEFILANFMEMNKLWVRIQHLPGDAKDKDARKRRERERNDLRILVGTNLVRLAQLEGVTSRIYGEEILPPILEHIVTTGDPLSQAYLMDCLVQVFPDEYHIETLPILLNVCPRLRDKVNIRTILQGLMDRLTHYLVGEAELLDEQDTNEVKQTLARDSFGLFEECVQKVYQARGPKLTAKEVIRLQTALLQFSLSCFPGQVANVGRCLDACETALRQALNDHTSLDDAAAVAELEKFLSLPLESSSLQVLQCASYPQLLVYLPHRRAVAAALLQQAPVPPNSAQEPLWLVLEPLLQSDATAAEQTLVAQWLHAIRPSVDLGVLQSIRGPGPGGTVLTALVWSALSLVRRVLSEETTDQNQGAASIPGVDPSESSELKNVESSIVVKDVDPNVSDAKSVVEPDPPLVRARKIFVFVQETIEAIAKNDAEKGFQLYLSASSTADGLAARSMSDEFAPISYELLRQAMILYEDRILDPNAQCRCITSVSGTLLSLKCIEKENYDTVVTKTAQFSAKVSLKPEQCQLVAQCAHLFFPADASRSRNPQRALECLQRSLKLADACTSTNATYVHLFVDLLEHYVFFFENKNPLITPAYISGLVALIKEHLIQDVVSNEKDVKAHFMEVLRYIQQRKVDSEVAELFSLVHIEP